MFHIQDELPMKKELDVIKSIDDDASVSMAAARESTDDHIRESADDTEGESGSCRWVREGVLVCHGGSFVFSLVV